MPTQQRPNRALTELLADQFQLSRQLTIKKLVLASQFLFARYFLRFAREVVHCLMMVAFDALVHQLDQVPSYCFLSLFVFANHDGDKAAFDCQSEFVSNSIPDGVIANQFQLILIFDQTFFEHEMVAGEQCFLDLYWSIILFSITIKFVFIFVYYSSIYVSTFSILNSGACDYIPQYLHPLLERKQFQRVVVFGVQFLCLLKCQDNLFFASVVFQYVITLPNRLWLMQNIIQSSVRDLV
ncbi:Hypothetical_protein [Hexamita inflata]|uniref:Hypothetical_protein n=1 Tax=Hexamita inflata TaxID=28002 RepID=A0ABP1HD09_9EUKA